MEGSPTIAARPQPVFPAPPRFLNLSSLGFILSLLAIVTVVPILIYILFFAANCPLFPSRWRRRRHSEKLEASDHADKIIINGSDVIKYEKARHEKDVGSECPVCLAGFAEEEDVNQLSACNHSFHASCINLWLSSHSNCPVCRAPVAVKRTKTRPFSARDDGGHHHGLPNAGSLV